MWELNKIKQENFCLDKISDFTYKHTYFPNSFSKYIIFVPVSLLKKICMQNVAFICVSAIKRKRGNQVFVNKSAYISVTQMR